MAGRRMLVMKTPGAPGGAKNSSRLALSQECSRRLEISEVGSASGGLRR